MAAGAFEQPPSRLEHEVAIDVDAEVRQLEAHVGVEPLGGQAVDLTRVLGLVPGDINRRPRVVVEEPRDAAHSEPVQLAHDGDDLVQVLGGHEAACAETHPVAGDESADALALGRRQDRVPCHAFGAGSHRSGLAP